ncbi:MAG: SMP-30/gluconolactonase/LRE family protein, partial [Verrucomicrobiota bacterium]
MSPSTPALVVLLSLAPMLAAAAEGVLAPGAKVERFAGGFKFTEGPAADKDGNVFFTDQPEDRIHKWSVVDE